MQQRVSRELPWCVLLMALALPAANAQPAPEPPAPEVIVVTARLPGPEMWKVSRGEHVLWLFGYPRVVPENLEWDSTRVERVLARAQEFLPAPRLELGVKIPRARLQLAEDQRLVDVLPEPVYRDYLQLKAELFPGSDGLERLRPHTAGASLLPGLFRRSGLKDGGDILQRLDRLVRRQRDLRRTRIEVKATRAERAQLNTLYLASIGALTPEQEVGCFAGAVANARSNIAVLQQQASAWAEGRVPDLIELHGSLDAQDYCQADFAATTERAIMQRLRAEFYAQWLAAVDTALARNETTVAVLDIGNLIPDSADGLLQELRERGYTVVAPGA